MAGAGCVQIGTSNFAEPAAALRISDELATLLPELGFDRVEAVVGSLQAIEPEPEYAERSPWEAPSTG